LQFFIFVFIINKVMDNEAWNKIKPGAEVRVYERVKEGDKERESVFRGIVLARKHGNEPGATFTVRAILAGVGVEKVFPIHSPAISRIEIISSPKKVRSSKLYWVRGVSGAKMRQRIKVSI
jgi:large subunit ribosomal protein L19